MLDVVNERESSVSQIIATGARIKTPRPFGFGSGSGSLDEQKKIRGVLETFQRVPTGEALVMIS